MHYLLLTEPGLEDLVAAEILERTPEARIDAQEFRGAIRVGGLDLDRLLALTTVQRIVEIRHEARVSSLDDARQACVAVDWPELTSTEPFRVTATRRGTHAFTHVELAGACGGALHKRYNAPVDLEQFKTEVRAELLDDRLVLGFDCSAGGLGKRIVRPQPLRTALKPVVAAAMIRLAGAHRGAGRLIDPMCGSATIPIEASRINPALTIEAADWDAPTIEVARTTMQANSANFQLTVGDVRELGRDNPAAFDMIVSDPPYGLRQATRIPLSSFYGPMLSSLEQALAPQGRIALIVLKQRTFERALAETQLQTIQRLEVDLGGIQTGIFLLRHA